MQRSSDYYGHKHMYSLIYRTLSTTDGLMFSLNGLVERQRHYLTLLHQNGWEDVTDEIFVRNGR